MTDIAQREVAQQLQALEEMLLDPAVRRDSARVAALLDEGFIEYGSSGRVWTRAAILDLLAHEEGYAEPPVVRDFACRPLAMGVVLATYRTVRMDSGPGKAREVLRSSIWVRGAQGWRILFHQGTSVAWS